MIGVLFACLAVRGQKLCTAQPVSHQIESDEANLVASKAADSSRGEKVIKHLERGEIKHYQNAWDFRELIKLR